MKISRDQVAENRRKILEAAGRLFRAKGFEAVTVAEVMKAAGLTHGGFYGHFASKDDLIAQALAHTLAGGGLATGGQGGSGLDGYAARYLTPEHCSDRAGGCPVAGLASEAGRQSADARAAMGAGLRRQIERLSADAPGNTPAERRRAAIGGWAAMVGAVILARMGDDPQLSDEVLAETRAWIAERG